MQFQNTCEPIFDQKLPFFKIDHDYLSATEINNQSKSKYRALATCRQQIRISNADQLIQSLTNYQPLSTVISMEELRKKTNISIKKYRESIYYGQFADGKRTGLGIMLYCNGRAYEGEWYNNFKHGKGYEKFQNGSTYSGEYSKGKPEGHGIHSWLNGQIYEGEWLDGEKSGSGIWRGPTGDAYIGEWKNSKANGYGVHTWANGDRYEGQFKDCMKHGQGLQKFFNGDSYKGSYIMGKPHGYGEYYWSNGSFFKGNFQNGLREGKGLWKRSSGNTDKYQGQYKQDKKQGYGVYTWQNGSFYKGNFQNDLKHGYGQMYWSDGRVYKGQWINNQPMGEIQQFKESKELKNREWPILLVDFQNMKEELTETKTHRTRLKSPRKIEKFSDLQIDGDFIQFMPGTYRSRPQPASSQSYRKIKPRENSPKKLATSRSGFQHNKFTKSSVNRNESQQFNRFVRKYSVGSRCQTSRKMKEIPMDKKMASSSFFLYKIQNNNDGLDQSEIKFKPRQIKTSGGLRHKQASQEIKVFKRNKINPQFI